ncbi:MULTISPECIES: LysR family transcriptional regulator [Sphingobium]|uniref:LysR family transcriptional regulator n=1 Tax=Sphingobium chungbukense TaxID=56193 RepID=A0A0M3APF3_9SPHN|nr:MULTISPECIES: LysR family transcriptional regulator [Sphingobium]KKW91808.1 LysR family transcriptional regulator [Sphingobium chungbukense]PJG45995.1 LysR family transcriptional regulator [Sphingobium sp. LB126]
MNRIAFYHIETLLWIARLGTFGAAADRLNASQPTISARIRELEGQIGFPLFQREGRNMMLTVRGREFVQRCETLWTTLQQTLLSPDEFRGASGIVRVGSGEIAAASCLPVFTNAIGKSMPKISLEIEIDLTAHLIDDLLSGRVDMVFAIGPITMPGIVAATIRQVELVWLASRELGESITEKGGEIESTVPLWSVARSSPMHDLMATMIRKSSFQHPHVHNCNNVRSLIDIVESGGGIGLFPLNMVEEKIAAGSLVKLDEEVPPPILLQTAMRSGDHDPIISELFRRSCEISYV